MSKGIDEIIRQAMQSGEFDNLPNQGKKLSLDEYFNLPEELRVGYTLLKNANFVPPEIELLKEIEALEIKLKSGAKEQASELRKQLQEKRLQYNILMEKHRKK